MIIKNKMYGNITKVTVAEFGKGTILTNVGINDNNLYVSVLLKTDKKPKKIGFRESFKGTSDDFKPEIALVFYNKESIDVLIERIQEAKKLFDELPPF